MSEFNFNISNQNNFNNKSDVIDFTAFSAIGMLLYNVLENNVKESAPALSISVKTLIVKSLIMQMNSLKVKNFQDAIHHVRALYVTIAKLIKSNNIQYTKEELIEMFDMHHDVIINSFHEQLATVQIDSSAVKFEVLREKIVETLNSDENISGGKFSEPETSKHTNKNEVDFSKLENLSISELKALEKNLVDDEQYEKAMKVVDVIRQKETNH